MNSVSSCSGCVGGRRPAGGGTRVLRLAVRQRLVGRGRAAGQQLLRVRAGRQVRITASFLRSYSCCCGNMSLGGSLAEGRVAVQALLQVRALGDSSAERRTCVTSIPGKEAGKPVGQCRIRRQSSPAVLQTHAPQIWATLLTRIDSPCMPCCCRSYEHFCACGKMLDARLEALGGKRFVPRTDVNRCAQLVTGISYLAALSRLRFKPNPSPMPPVLQAASGRSRCC